MCGIGLARLTSIDSASNWSKEISATLLRSSAPIFVQHTRLDSRDPHIALMTTMAFPVPA